MTLMVALVRGINVGGNPLAMTRLVQVCAGLGFLAPRTYLQSGNVLFHTSHAPAQAAGLLERALANESRIPPAVLVRTPVELANVITSNPFAALMGAGTRSLHVTFLESLPTQAAVAAVESLQTGGDRVRVVGMHAFIHCPPGDVRATFNNNVLEKMLGVRATTRNWRSVNALEALARG